MTANRQTGSRAALGSVAALSLALGACVGPVQAPVAAPPPARPAPPPASAPQTAAPADWQDAPATPGEWRWSREGSLSVARFGEPTLLSLTCDARAGIVTVARSGRPGVGMMSILTTSLSRTVAAPPRGDGAVVGSLPARDSMLDAMAYSRGRFAVKVAGMEPLYLPSWPEVARVIEDCR